MENNFTKVMSTKTDEELIIIVTINRNKYQPLAIEAAQSEIDLRNITISEQEEIVSKIESKKQIIQEIDDNAVKRRIRLVNFVVDFVIIFIIYFLAIPSLDRLIYASKAGFTLYRLASLILFIALYYIPFEYKTQKTLGKIITKTKVVTLQGNKPELMDIVSRTFCRLIPFDRFSFLFSRNGFHDAISKTKVINDNV